MVYQRAKERHGVEAMAWAVARGAATSRKRVNECTPQDNEDPVLDRRLPDRFVVHSSGHSKREITRNSLIPIFDSQFLGFESDAIPVWTDC